MAGVVVTMDAREARLFQAMNKLVEKQAQVNAKFTEGGKKSEEAGRQSKDAFDKSTLSVDKLKASTIAYVSGLASVAVAVGVVRNAWEQVRKEQDAGLAALQKTQTADRRLLQISQSAEEFSQLRSQADTLAGQFGVDRAVVREVIFSAVSENFRDAVPAIIAANQVIDPVSAAGVAGQVPALFKGTIGALEAVDLTLKAAQASRLDFEQIARSLPQAAEGGGIAKATAEETLAVLSVLASEFKSGETAADRIKAFATKAGISGDLSGIGMVAVVEKLQAMDEAARKKFLGDSNELNVAYVKMSENLELIKQRIADISSERERFQAGQGLLAGQTAIAAADERSAALLREARAKQQFEQQQANVSGVSGATGSAAALAAQRRLLTTGNLIPRLVDRAGVGTNTARVASLFGIDAETSGALGAGVAQIGGGNSVGGILSFMEPFFTSQARVSDRMNEAARNLNEAAGKIGDITPQARAQAAGAGN